MIGIASSIAGATAIVAVVVAVVVSGAIAKLVLGLGSWRWNDQLFLGLVFHVPLDLAHRYCGCRLAGIHKVVDPSLWMHLEVDSFQLVLCEDALNGSMRNLCEYGN
jgi:hypothetical protein